jgi:hypothetical protein
MSRPYLNSVKPYTWRSKDGTETPGILLNNGRHPVAHLTPAEAYNLANTLTDLAESIEQGTN